MFFISNMAAEDIFIDIPESEFNTVMFHMIKKSGLRRMKEVFDAVVAREGLGATAIGNNTAIPHCRMKDFKGFFVKFALFRDRLGYKASNGEEIRFVFLIIGSSEDPGYYLRTLAYIASIMRHGDIRRELLGAKSEAEIPGIFRKYEEKELESRYSHGYRYLAGYRGLIGASRGKNK